MQKKTRMILAVFAASCAALSLGAAGIPIGEETPESWKVVNPEKTGQKLEIVDYSQEVGKVIRISMNPATFPYTEMIPQRGFRIASSADEFNGTISFDLFSDHPEAILTTGIRLLDANNEVFQYSKPVKLAPGQWQKITIPLNPNIDAASIFGGDKNRKLDYPVRILSFLVDCRRNFSEPLMIYLDHVQWNRE